MATGEWVHKFPASKDDHPIYIDYPTAGYDTIIASFFHHQFIALDAIQDALGYDIRGGYPTLNDRINAIVGLKPFRTFAWPKIGALAVETDFAPTLSPDTDLTILEVFLVVKTAPGVGKTITADVRQNGVSIFSATPANRPSITGTDKTGTSGPPDVVAIHKNDLLTVDIVEATADHIATDLTLHLRCQKT